ncbi:MAG: FG-GAP-like repeat-containing protein [Acidobacteriota bacterium]|nr:FG-GAP-like repeat-containing protein [Acidobacteriota bacterium]
MRHFIQAATRLFVVIFISASAFAAALEPTGAVVPGEVLVKIQPGASLEEIAHVEELADAGVGQRISTLSSGTIWRLRSRSKSVEALTASLAGNPKVVYVEPNYILHLVATPNDTSYGQLWGLKNTGQYVHGMTGTAGSDIDAEAAWNLTTGSASIVVGVIDTGVDYNHPDLAANMWSNPGGKGNAACAAGTHGFNAITMTCNPMDDHYHGTHVSGTIGAVGNNGLGVAGVNWTTSIMALKFLGSNGSGTTAGAITAIEFAVQAKIEGVNVRVLSNSWGGGAFSKALLDEINWANQNDILFVAAAGNNGSNNDTYAHYPSNYATPNMISVAATDNRDNTAYFTNYGLTTVHLGAPGVNILSCYLGSSYITISGTSMATPHVAGVAALVLANAPSLTTAQVKSAILNNTDPISSLAGRTVTGGRLNAARALGLPPEPDFTISANPTSRAILQGASTTYTITVTPAGAFAGSVDFSVTGLPTGASGSFSPASSATSSTLTVSTSPSTPLGSAFLTVTGVSGALSRTASVHLSMVTTPPAPPVLPCPSFTFDTQYHLSNTTSIAIGDFNRDGKPDFAYTNVVANIISIRLGTGSGTFTTASSYSTGNNPLSVTVTDINGDGKIDLAVANSGSHNVSVLLGNGDGTFQTAVAYGAGTSPFSIATGDFDNDGKSDLVVANNGSSSVSVLLGQGDGTFEAAVQYGASAGPFGVAVGDFDGDGSADLAVANHHAGSVSILHGNGDGTFDVAVDHDVAERPSSVAAGDFNGDGAIDLATSNFGSNSVSILAGTGDGTFDAAVHYPAGTNPYWVATGDFNADGAIDLAVANNTLGDVSVLMGNGTGAFQAPITFETAEQAAQVSVADFNGDGKSDLAVVNAQGISILMNVGTCSLSCSTIAAPVHYTVGGAPNGLATGDFNRDGNTDIAAATRDANNVVINLGNGDGTFYSGVTIGVATNPDSATAGDFNRDGSLDIAVANSGSNNTSVLLGNGDGTFQSPVAYALGTTPRSIAAADFNRDGILDLVSANGGSDDVSVLLGNGNGTFQTPIHYGAGTTPFHVAAGDFNRDGRVDLAVANFGSANVSILTGNGNGTFQTAVNFAAGTNPRSIVSADLNRDGKVDLAAVNNGSGNVSVLLGNGNGTFQTAVNYTAGTSPFSATAGDFNDNGTLDLAVVNNGSNNVSILLGTGTGTFATAVNSAAGSSPATIVAADFNRDGKPDLATASSGSGSVALLRNTCPVPDLTITKSHTGSFTQGNTGKTYTITVTNSGEAPTAGDVVVTDTLPIGLNATAMSGTGWTCTVAPLTCTRNDALTAGASYPPITLTVNVASGAPASVTNTVTVSGGGELNGVNSTASDTAAVAPAIDLIVTSSHAGSFTQGATGKTYTIIARNAGGLPTTGVVTVSDTLPSGLIATAISGTGWACTLGTLTCTRGDVLAATTSYPAITLTVNVAANAPAVVTNTANVSGGGQTNTANDTATDPTVVWKTQTCGSFGAPVFYGASYYTYGVAIGNFNGDGKADLAVINTYPNTISIFLGNGNGTFQSAVDYPVGDSPYSIATADMNNDGHTDLVVTSSDAGTASLLLGNGDGSFASPTSYSVGSYPRSVALSDLDGDGNQDVVVTNYYSSTASVLLGSGNGTLQTPVTYPVGYSPRGVAVSDFDGNGTADLAVMSAYDGVKILLGNGDGTLQAAVTYSSIYNAYSLTVGDFNQDGKRDLAIASSYYGVAILLGNGDGSFQAAVSYPASYGSQAIVADDLNGDGKLDLVVANSGSDSISTLLGNGDGTFQPATSYYAGNSPAQLAISDFNGDGMPDLALATYYAGGAAVMLGGCADLTIAKSHVGDFGSGHADKMYSLKVSNSGDGASRGTVTVTDTLPAGLTATSISGSGWSCTLATLTCTRSDALSSGASYSDVKVWVDVNGNAPASVINTASVSGGGDTNNANNSASDPTTIVQAPDLTITKTHSGTFLPGEIGRTYTINVTNSGPAATNGTVTVADELPFGLGASALTGAGWNCVLAQLTCSRSDALAGGASYPPITLTVNVYSYAPETVTNYATVSGGGDLVTNNNTAADLTEILTAPTYLFATAYSASYVDLDWSHVSHATSYEILRSANNGPFVVVGTSTWSDYYDDSVSPSTTYLYRVRAVAGSATGGLSPVDLATTIAFTDNYISTGYTKMKAAHITELRTAVNAVRIAGGLSPTVFTDSTLTVGSFIKAVHLTELRASLNQARTTLGLSAVGYADATIPAGSKIKAAHIRELREGVK